MYYLKEESIHSISSDQKSMKSNGSKYSRQHSLYEDEDEIGCFTVLTRFLMKKRKEYRDRRLHPILLEYKQKILAFEEARKEKIAAELRAHERAVQREVALREAKRLRFEREVIRMV